VKRRSFLKRGGAGAAAAAGAALFPAPAVAQGRRRWRMLTTWPKNFPGLGTGAQRIADAITEMSGGRLEVKLFAAGELVPAFEVFDAVRAGNAEMGHDAPLYWVAKNKATAFFTAVPGGLSAHEQFSWVYYGGGQALWDELYAEFGLRAWLAGTTGPNWGGWFRQPIDSLDDFRGLSFRLPGLGGEVMNRMGAVAVNMPGGEIMQALQSGVLDGAEWVNPWADLAFGFHKVARYYYGPGVHEPGATQSLLVNRAAYESLPADLQAIVRHAAGQENARMHAEMTAGNAAAFPRLKAEGVDVRTFPEAVYRRLFEVSADVVAEVAEEGPTARRIYESWSKFRKQVMDLAPYTEMGYMRVRGL